VRGTTGGRGRLPRANQISIHVPRERDDRMSTGRRQPTDISIHVPRERDDAGHGRPLGAIVISIHVPRERDDQTSYLPMLCVIGFQSTSLVRGTTGKQPTRTQWPIYFNPRPS